MAETSLSVVIPIYNEKDALSRLQERLEGVLEAADFPIEIILVNDGSTDGSKEVLDGVQAENLRVIHHPQNRGYGASLKTGVMAATHDWIAITDADETYPDDRIPELFTRAHEEDFDMVVGARTGANVKVPLLRRPPKWILRRLASSLSGFTVPDLNSGLRVMRKEMVLDYLHVLPDGFSFTSTITLAALSSSRRVDYVPIDYFERSGSSKIRPIYDTLNFLQLIIRTVLWFNPLRVFLTTSALLLLLSFAVLFGSWAAFGKPMDVTFAVLFMTAVIVLAIGMLADLIDKRMR